MSDQILEEYIGQLVDPRGEPVVRQLDRIIRATEPGLAMAIKYKILMYGLAGDFHTWVCAINSGRRHVSVLSASAANRFNWARLVVAGQLD